MKKKDMAAYAEKYKEEDLLEKLGNFAFEIGVELGTQAMLLKRIMLKPEVPVQAKLTIVAALGYLICPVDLIPDFVPVLGYTDDAAVIAAALETVKAYTTPEDRRLAQRDLDNLFA